MRNHKKQGSRKWPASSRKPSSKLSEGAVQASVEALITFHQLVADVFERREQQAWFFFYLCGQLSNLERKTIEPMVLALQGAVAKAIRALQHHIGQGHWDPHRLMVRLQTLVRMWLGDPNGVLIVDGSGFPKQGHNSVGVARQYCGHLGKVANCQEGVFVVYASHHGYAFIDKRLYLPQSWFGSDASARWQTCGIPNTTRFRTEPELAVEMISEVVAQDRLPFRWVTADEHFGQSPAFLQGISALHKWFLAEVPADTRFWTRRPGVVPPGRGLLGRPRLYPRLASSAPAPRQIRERGEQLPRSAWKRYTLKEGSRGPMQADFAFLRLVRVHDKLPSERVWVILRRSLSQPTETKYYISNAPASCSPSTFVWLSGMRWPIETAFEEGKGEVGMDHYETRTWPGWHHHMVQTFAAYLFLTYLRLSLQKKSGAHPRSGTAVSGPGSRRRKPTFTRYRACYSLSPTAKSCCLPVSS